MTSRDLVIQEELRIHNLRLPYLYGGQSEHCYLKENQIIEAGFDCSGNIVELIRMTGHLLPTHDLSVAGIVARFRSGYAQQAPAIGAFPYYGTKSKPVHIGIMITDQLMISFSGGDYTIKTINQARQRNAGSHIRHYKYRRDLLGFINLFNSDGSIKN